MGKTRSVFTYTNTRDRTVSVIDVESSCPCLQVSGFPARVDPGQSIELAIDFDPSNEPDFRGQLLIVLKGKGQGDVELFRTQAEVEVADDAPARPAGQPDSTSANEPTKKD